jgi:hypothetical protein
VLFFPASDELLVPNVALKGPVAFVEFEAVVLLEPAVALVTLLTTLCINPVELVDVVVVLVELVEFDLV